ncbi:MAG: acetyl-CoA hydrolase/transferase family protein [Pseudooceanicola nanhaiensis]|uniref:acetyl-CoA hydrolase/transferase family protein n=1 Tax=Rhodobacterales TaxID=204455 RepID=UPI004057DC15
MIWTQGAGEPVTILTRMLDQLADLPPVAPFLGASYSALLRPEHAERMTLSGMGAVGTTRALAAEGLMDVVPCHLSALPRLIADGVLPFDVVILQVSQRADGRFGTGAVNGYVQSAMSSARVVIAEVNAQAPDSTSTTIFDPGQFTHIVKVDAPLVEQHQPAPAETDRAIARHVADFIRDGDILQIGIGGVPLALAGELRDRRHLGLHSGVIGDSVGDLIEAGVIDNSTKKEDRGVAVTGVLAGSRRLFDFAHHNPALMIEPVWRTHAPGVLASIRNLVAVNSAIEVDLTGQVGSEMVGRRYMGTIGGQNDFVRGALLSDGGRSIIALPSRTARGQPRIVPLVRSGVVTVPSSDADIVVTEFGAAELRGRGLRDRRAALIAIAHPDDREALDQTDR